MMRIVTRCIAFALLLTLPTAAVEASNYAKGPLTGKNFMLTFIPYHTLPGVPARKDSESRLQAIYALYVTQDFYPGLAALDIDYSGMTVRGVYENVYVDFENYTFETGFSINLRPELEIGITTRFLKYTGGVFDNVIEEYHFAVGELLFSDRYLLNAARHLFPQNGVQVMLRTTNTATFSMHESTSGYGDVDVWARYTILQNSKVAVAAYAAFKIPTGSPDTVTGSGCPDLGIALLTDVFFGRYFTAYLQAGVVLPAGSLIAECSHGPRPMFNGLAGIEYHPWRALSVIIQMNVRSSPVASYYHNASGELLSGNAYFTRPQTNLLVGAVISLNDIDFQIYLEEDPFTNAGADVTLNLSVRKGILL